MLLFVTKHFYLPETISYKTISCGAASASVALLVISVVVMAVVSAYVTDDVTGLKAGLYSLMALMFTEINTVEVCVSELSVT